MSSDQRWTGGLANREWQAGRPAEPTVDADYIKQQVKCYLADCVKNDLTSTEAMCLKVVFHATDDQKKAVIWAYRRAKSDQYVGAEQRGAETANRVLGELLDRAAMPGQLSEPECLASHCPPSASVDCEYPKCAPGQAAG